MIARDRYHQPAAEEPSVDTDRSAPGEGPGSPDAGAAQPDTTEPTEAGQESSSSVAAVATVAAVGEHADDDAAAPRRGLEIYGDSAYGTGEARAKYRQGGHDTMIKPKPLRPAVPGGFTLDDFTIDEQVGTVTCPGGHTRTMSPKRTVTFGAVCVDCPLRARCTTAKDGRSMSIHEHEQLLRAARAQARTPEFQRAYPTRSMVERVVAWTATSRGRRIKLRYLGVDKNHAWLRTRCAAINLRTLINSGLTRGNGAWALA
jgi:hypothetical protein